MPKFSVFTCLKIIFAAMVFVVIFSCRQKVFAKDESTILIGEILWSGSSSSSFDEFIELTNTTNEVIDISNYSIWDETKIDETTKELKPKLMLTIPDGQIAPQGKFLISNYPQTEAKSIINIKPDIVDSDVSLSNEKLKISLRDSTGKTIDIAGDGLRPFFYSEIMSLNTGGHKYKASIERSNYAVFNQSKIDKKENWRIAQTALNIKTSFFNTNSSQDELINDLANPENSGRPKVSNFVLVDNSYELNLAKAFLLNYVVEDTDDDFESIEIEATTGEENSKVELELSPGQHNFSLPKSNRCWEIVFIFKDAKGLSTKELQKLNCYEKNRLIKFSEVLTSPRDIDWDLDGKANSYDEWFEIKNDSPEDTNLEGWFVQDKSGKTARLSAVIKAGEFKTLYYRQTNLSLNNGGEELYLFDPSGEKVDSVVVPALTYNESYAKFGDGWKKTSTPTPNVENRIPKVIVESPTDGSSALDVQKSSMEEEEIVPDDSPESEREIVTKQTVIHATLASHLRTNDVMLSKVEPAVLASESQRVSKPFKVKTNLLYFYFGLMSVAVILIFGKGLYEIYRRE